MVVVVVVVVVEAARIGSFGLDDDAGGLVRGGVGFRCGEAGAGFEGADSRRAVIRVQIWAAPPSTKSSMPFT